MKHLCLSAILLAIAFGLYAQSPVKSAPAIRPNAAASTPTLANEIFQALWNENMQLYPNDLATAFVVTVDEYFVVLDFLEGNFQG